MYISISMVKKKQILIACNESLTNINQIYFNDFFGLIRAYAEYRLSQNEESMDVTYSSLRSLIFQYNKEKYVKRIVDSLFDEAVSKLEELSKANANDLSKKITVDIIKKGTADYILLKEKNMPMEHYISQLIEWVQMIISTRELIKMHKENLEEEVVEKL